LSFFRWSRRAAQARERKLGEPTMDLEATIEDRDETAFLGSAG
jgi:hypothetical protein